MPMTQSREDYPGNVRLAQAIRRVEEIHEASYNRFLDRCTKRYRDCIREVVGDDPIATILACLFTAGFSDMYDFCDTVLGPQEDKGNDTK